MWWLLRKSVTREPLPITMSGVRAGERVLQIDVADPATAAGIAAKVGLGGEATILVRDERDEARMRQAAADAGALVEVVVTPFDRLPPGDGTFDLVVIHGAPEAAPAGAASTPLLHEARRVVRPGGRLMIIAPGTPEGLGAWFGRRAPVAAEDGLVAALAAVGFRPVRQLADQGGYRFIEGIRPA